MECPECLRVFNEKWRRPKALPCGHTVCLECLQKTDMCPLDRLAFGDIPSALPDNQSVLVLLRSSISASGRSLYLWCTDCAEKAVENCVDEGHKITSKKKHWRDQVLQNLHLSDKLNPQYFTELVDNLDEEAASRALKLLSGQVSPPPLQILLKGEIDRWTSSLSSSRETESDDDKAIKGMLLLLASEGAVHEDLIVPSTVEEQNSEPLQEEAEDSDTTLNLTNITSCNKKDFKADREKLLFSDRFSKVRCITGLFCDMDREWSLKLLKQGAPFLEEVHLHYFYLEHLEAVRCMPDLRWLVLEFCKGKLDTSDYQLPELQHQSKVEFLWVSLPPYRNGLKLLKDIVRSYSVSLRTLYVSLPSYHTDAIEFFNEMEMPYLELLLFSTYCSSDGCGRVMTELRVKFPRRKIRCMGCNRTETFDD